MEIQVLYEMKARDKWCLVMLNTKAIENKEFYTGLPSYKVRNGVHDFFPKTKLHSIKWYYKKVSRLLKKIMSIFHYTKIWSEMFFLRKLQVQT